MSDGPWIKFYPSDWLVGTSGMSAAEIGVYITLISMMYEKGGAIVLNTVVLARRCGLPAPSFTKVLEHLIEAGKMVVEGGGLINRRVQEELHARANARDRAEKAARQRRKNINKISPKILRCRCLILLPRARVRYQMSEIRKNPRPIYL